MLFCDILFCNKLFSKKKYLLFLVVKMGGRMGNKGEQTEKKKYI